MSKYIKLDTTVQNLEYDKSWKLLSTKEQNYAYYLFKASWAGAKMVFNQISYESPALFILFQLYFQGKDFQGLQEAAEKKAGVTSEEWQRFIAYVAGFYSNMGNYHAFGHSKFVPELDHAKFRGIILSNPLYQDEKYGGMYREYVDRLLPLLEREVFALDKPFASLGFPEEGGVTGYFSPNMTAADLKLIRDFFTETKLSPLNTRAFKLGENNFEITVGSIEQSKKEQTFQGAKVTVTYGEFAPYLEEVNYYLTKAREYAANDN
jgi:dipeptidyl-peptidase-3